MSRRGDIEVGVAIEALKVTFTIGRELRSPNRWKRHLAEWAESKTWQRLLLASVRNLPLHVLFPWPEGRRRVTVTRWVPTRRNFLLDRDNQHFVVKPLNDALKRLGWIKDDREIWLEQPIPTQEVSGDGRYWTIVEIEPCGKDGGT